MTKVRCNNFDCINNSGRFSGGLCCRKIINLVNLAGAEDLFNCQNLRWNKAAKDEMKHKRRVE